MIRLYDKPIINVHGQKRTRTYKKAIQILDLFIWHLESV